MEKNRKGRSSAAKLVSMKPTHLNQLSEYVILIYLTFVSLLILAFRSRIIAWPPLLLSQILAILILIVVVKLQGRFPGSDALVFIRNWLPVPYIFFSYRMIHFLVNCDRNPGFLPDRDPLLIAADRLLFGVDPTVWLERITVPWLTELMQLVYSTNYFLPLVLALLLYLNRRRLPFQKSVYLLTLGYFLSFLGYFLVPAVGPRFTIVHSRPLAGVFFQEKLCHLLYFMEARPRDCFPSGHTEIPLITLWLAHRFQRGLFWIYLPLVTLLICSTVYLRFHYVVDVLVGMALAGIVIFMGRSAIESSAGNAD